MKSKKVNNNWNPQKTKGLKRPEAGGKRSEPPAYGSIVNQAPKAATENKANLSVTPFGVSLLDIA